MEARDCEGLYTDCFNCTTCEEEVDYLEECLCSWDSNNLSCKSITSNTSPFIFYQAFSNCDDLSSNSIKSYGLSTPNTSDNNSNQNF